MNPDQPAGPTVGDWANTNVHVTLVNREGNSIFEIRKEMVVNGVRHVQFVWVNQAQLRTIGINHGL